jgi:hypothetical protein
LDLAAVDADNVGSLPQAQVTTTNGGEMAIRFGERILIEGVITRATPHGRVLDADSDRMVVTRVAVEGSDGR